MLYYKLRTLSTRSNPTYNLMFIVIRNKQYVSGAMMSCNNNQMLLVMLKHTQTRCITMTERVSLFSNNNGFHSSLLLHVLVALQTHSSTYI